MFLLRIFCFCCISFLVMNCNNEQKNKENKNSVVSKTVKSPPKMDFKGKNLVDLGKIKEGDKIKHTFEFENTGNSPLLISYANASCGCTVPSWPKEAIPVGGKSAITVEFNSKNKEGKLHKNVSIYSNTVPEFNTVAFDIEVIK